MAYDPLNSRQSMAMGMLVKVDPQTTGLRIRDPFSYEDLPTDMHRMMMLLDDSEQHNRNLESRLREEKRRHQLTREKLKESNIERSKLKRAMDKIYNASKVFFEEKNVPKS